MEEKSKPSPEDTDDTAEVQNGKDDKEKKLLRLSKQIETSLITDPVADVPTELSAAESVMRKRRSCAEPDQKVIIKFSKGKDGKVVATSTTEDENRRSSGVKRDASDFGNDSFKGKRSRQRSRSTGASSRDSSLGQAEGSPSTNSPSVTEEADSFCWQCHKVGASVPCVTCPRLFHEKCVTRTAQNLCPECSGALQADSEKHGGGSNRLKLDQFCQLLKFALQRMKDVSGSNVFWTAVDTSKFPKYRTYIQHPMDLEQLKLNIDKKMYGSTVSFLSDAKWILHNSIVFNGAVSNFTTTARNILKTCRQELEEIDKCSDCYYNAHTKTDWFIQVCKKPHLLIWGRLKGYPFWPAKALTINPKTQLVDARFFGEHDKAWIHIRDCFVYSENCPPSTCKKRGDIDAAFSEINKHIAKLREKYGFVLGEDRTGVNAEAIDDQLSAMMPGWKPSVAKKAIAEMEEGEYQSVNPTEAAVEPPEPSPNGSEEDDKPETPVCQVDTSDVNSGEKTVIDIDGPKSSKEASNTDKKNAERKQSIEVAESVPNINDEKTVGHKKRVTKTPQPDSDVEFLPVEVKQENFDQYLDEENQNSGGVHLGGAGEGNVSKNGSNMSPMVAITQLKLLNVFQPESNKKILPKTGLKRNSIVLGKPSNKARKSIPRVNNSLENPVTITTSSSEAPSKDLNRSVNVISIDSKNSDAQRTLLRSLALEKKINNGPSKKESTTSPPQRSTPLLNQSPPNNTNPIVISTPAYITNAGQLYTTTQNSLGHVSLVPLTPISGGLNYVNNTSAVNAVPPPLTPLGAQATPVAPVPASTPLISVKSTASLKEPITCDSIRSIVQSQINTSKINEVVQESLINILGRLGSSFSEAQSQLYNAEKTRIAQQHKKTIDDLKATYEKQMSELASRYEQAAKRMEEEKRKALMDQEKSIRQVIDDVKKKQWCAYCWNEALYYCCWNTSYCDHRCQQQHWLEHVNVCSQKDNNSAPPPAPPPDSTPVLKTNRRMNGSPSRSMQTINPRLLSQIGLRPVNNVGSQVPIRPKPFQGQASSSAKTITYPGPSSKKSLGRVTSASTSKE